MLANEQVQAPPPQLRPAFIIGVTGHMDISSMDRRVLKERVRCVFRVLKCGARVPVSPPQSAHRYCKCDAKIELATRRIKGWLHKPLREPHEQAGKRSPFFDEWPGLEQTPIVVLTALAPGADQLVAEVALEDEFQNAGFQVRCPISFPEEMYARATTFVRHPEEQHQPDNARRVAHYKSLLAEIKAKCRSDAEPVFHVAMQSDVDLDSAALSARCESDLKDPDRRRKRYQAAGEYIATFSHLMIAIWDHIDESEMSAAGTAAVVRSRRAGRTPGLLPTTSSLALPADGPTLQLYTLREKRRMSEQLQPATAAKEPEWAMRWLFPISSKKQIATSDERTSDDTPPPTEDDLARWEEAGLAKFIADAKRLNNFSQRSGPDPARTEQDMRIYLSYVDKKKKEVPVDLASTSTSSRLYQMVKRVNDFRRRAADEERHQEQNVAIETLIRLFQFSLLAAILLDAFNHWHARADHHVADHSDRHQVVSTAPESRPAGVSSGHSSDQHLAGHQSESERELLSGTQVSARVIRFAIGGGAILLAFSGWVVFWVKRPQQHDENAHDLRVIAEGARVQMLWFMAGIGRSVPASYMHRQRPELSWIRQAIRSVAMPYEDAKWAFDKLPREMQIGLLHCVFYNWLRGRKKVAQFDYFHEKTAERIEELHFWHKLGCVLVAAGLCLSVLQVLAALPKVWGIPALDKWAAGAASLHLGWLLLIPVAAYLLSGGRWREMAERFLKRHVRTQDPNDFAHKPNLYKRQLRVNFRWYLWGGIQIAFFAFLLAVVLLEWDELGLLPNIEAWATILAATLLILGVLSIAWKERQLHSEYAYQYSTMSVLFNRAANRIEPMLEELANCHCLASDQAAREIAADRHEAKLSTSDRLEFDRENFLARLRTDSEARYEPLLREIQAALYALGIEALDENAEWLMLHRARPLEPVWV